MIIYDEKDIPEHLRKYFEPAELGLEPTFQEYINKLCDIFDEVKRVLKKEGTCWVNMGDTYGTQGGQNRKTDKDYSQYESIKLTNREIGTELIKQQGFHKCLLQIPSRFAIEMCNRDWILRNEIIWHKPNCMPSSVKDRFTVDFEKIFFFTKSKKYYFETQYEPSEYEDRDKRRKYGYKGKVIGDGFRNEIPNRSAEEFAEKNCPDFRNKRCVWRITTKPFKEAHFATYPESLCEIPIKAGCPEFVCKKCGKAREKIQKSIGTIEQVTAEVIVDKSKPYAVVERTGFVEVRDLPELRFIKEYLAYWKKERNLSVEKIEEILNSQAPHHWFSGESYPSKEDWLKIKELLCFDDKFDKQMTEVKYKPAEKLSGEYKEILTDCGCNAGWEGGIVLDPFFGAGTTGLVALKQNKKFIGIELNPEYIKIAEERLKPFMEQNKLLKNDETKIERYINP